MCFNVKYLLRDSLSAIPVSAFYTLNYNMTILEHLTQCMILSTFTVYQIANGRMSKYTKSA